VSLDKTGSFNGFGSKVFAINFAKLMWRKRTMKKLFLIFGFTLLSACTSFSTPTPEPSATFLVQPSMTPTLIPTPTATTAFPTASPFPTPDPNFYREDFDSALDASWTWVREDSRTWNLTETPGSLQISISRGYVAAHSNTNLLLRPAPKGNFLIETKIAFKPTNNFQFAGLIFYQSDSNFIQAGSAYCNAVRCVGEGLYMDAYRKGIIVQPNFGPTPRDVNPIWLRLSRTGDLYNFEASSNGTVWFFINSQTSDFAPTQIGLVSGQRLRGGPLVAVFDYFEVHGLP
jgi:regulation of enolase protein 1 (concanavalin A-like superfamily)